MIYHLRDDYIHTDPAKPPPKTAIQPLMFLSRLLTAAEKNYWPTELEVSGLVWVVRKIRCKEPDDTGKRTNGFLKIGMIQSS